ncbi:Uncharacterised protein [uncultured archaeon]|nr:Uncharacterised protein [uncultured archaeon]
MSSIRKQVLVNGQVHFIEVNSSLELEEVEVTGADPVSGKVVQVSLSPMLKQAQNQQGQFGIPPSSPAPAWPGLGEQTQQSPPSTPAPMDMFSEPALASQINPPLTYNSVPAPPSGIFSDAAAGEETQQVEQPAQGLESIKRKSEKEEVDDTLNGMYRY